MLNKEQKAILNKMSTWKPQNFPNGSSYSKQYLQPTIGSADTPIIVEADKQAAWLVSFDNGKTFVTVVKEWRDSGRGISLGKWFNSRDQILSALA